MSVKIIPLFGHAIAFFGDRLVSCAQDKRSALTQAGISSNSTIQEYVPQHTTRIPKSLGGGIKTIHAYYRDYRIPSGASR